MLGYEKRYMVNEDFRPQPTPDPEILSQYLGEFTCREFARLKDLDVVVLRLGRLAQLEPGVSSHEDLPLTSLDDVAAAVALAAGNGDGGDGPGRGPWNVVHIHSEARSSRFPLTKAKRLLRFLPK
jgi:nucleoside-diphosphate-sugar epimerase